MLKHYLQRLNLKTSKKRNKANQRLILRQKYDHFYRLQTIVRLKEVRWWFVHECCDVGCQLLGVWRDETVCCWKFHRKLTQNFCYVGWV